MPYVAEYKGHALRCMTDPDHDTYKSKYTGTRKLWTADNSQVEVYVTTGQEIGSAIEISDQATAMARVDQALDIGQFGDSKSNSLSPAQREALALVSFAYGLDPVMGELIPYQGKPYVTVRGRRRKDDEAGNRGDISFKLLTSEETEYYLAVGALARGDVAGYCVIRDVRTGAQVQGFGRVLASEGGGQGSSHLPQAQRRIEMAQKRQEMRAREMLWGPIARPNLGMDVIVEGDEPNLVEGQPTLPIVGPPVDVVADNIANAAEPRIVDAAPAVDHTFVAVDQSMPDLGNCPEHEIAWVVDRANYGLRASHHLSGRDYCRFSAVYKSRFGAAYRQRYGANEGEGQINDWLKTQFDGRTWSKLDPVEQLEALTRVTTLPAGPKNRIEPEYDTEEPSPPYGDATLETGNMATETITEEQVANLMRLAEAEVSMMDLLTQIKALTGKMDITQIRVDQYGAIVDWVNNQIDVRLASIEH